MIYWLYKYLFLLKSTNQMKSIQKYWIKMKLIQLKVTLQQKSNQKRKFSDGITREELGQTGWTLLHMISATLSVDLRRNSNLKSMFF
ncbi:unnamed protein product [Paramecium pentaurelia]|uniref:Uncharacterized protein n=1 Tax=Paramecium pentaurelia TaxID=43138 RepID=A0A8S1UC40_9CILI|nr:unnamed protein product [Paramecium pentaurelia]